MHIALLAGEPSGDQLGAELIKSFRRIDPCICFDGIGGPLMEAEGFTSLLPMSDFSVMGISEIITALPRLLKHKRTILHYYQGVLPDAFVGIDYPEFNLSIEKKLKEWGVFSAHYASPSVWAWRENRIRHIKSACDLMLTLFHFEKAFYDQHNMPAVHCGHPLVDIIPDTLSSSDTLAARQQLELPTEEGKHLLAVLPGSRKSEVEKMLPVFIHTMRELQKLLPTVQFLIPCANQELEQVIAKLMEAKGCGLPYHLIKQQAKITMTAADAVLLASGTAALEAMLLQKPMVVSYKVSAMTALIASRLVKVPHFSLPNLLADHPIVPEFMQNEINPTEMAMTLSQLILPTSRRQQMIDDLIRTRTKVRPNGADTAAKAILGGITRKDLQGA